GCASTDACRALIADALHYGANMRIAMPILEEMPHILAALRKREAAMLRLLAAFARAESPTDSKQDVDHFGRMVAAEWRRRGARICRAGQSYFCGLQTKRLEARLRAR